MVAVGPVIVGVDGSDASKRALLWAVEYVKCSGAQLEALAAWQTPTNYGFPAYYDDVDFARQTSEKLEATVRETAPDLNIGLRVEQAHPAAALVAASKQAQLLVVGQRGHGEFHDRLLGSVSQHCVHHAHSPVVVVRGRSTEAG